LNHESVLAREAHETSRTFLASSFLALRDVQTDPIAATIPPKRRWDSRAIPTPLLVACIFHVTNGTTRRRIGLSLSKRAPALVWAARHGYSRQAYAGTLFISTARLETLVS